MRSWGLFASALVGLFLAFPASAATLVVNVTADDREKAPAGHLRVGVFNHPSAWLEEGGELVGQAASMPALEQEYVFEGLPAGRYAVAAYIDENDNRKTDTNLLGIPTEWVGFSQNPSYSFGPPSFEDASIELGQDETAVIEIKLDD